MQKVQTAMMACEEGKGRFNYRVVGIALHGDRVLLHRAENDDFWSLPGGRVHLLEPSEESLKREMREELGVEIQVERLVWVVENFFEYNGIAYHEFALYFLMTFPSGSCLYEQDEPFAGNEEGVRLIFKWHQRDELEGFPFYPSFLRRALNAIPDVPAYIVHTDGKE